MTSHYVAVPRAIARLLPDAMSLPQPSRCARYNAHGTPRQDYLRRFTDVHGERYDMAGL